jgi:hypothetical protein
MVSLAVGFHATGTGFLARVVHVAKVGKVGRREEWCYLEG